LGTLAWRVHTPQRKVVDNTDARSAERAPHVAAARPPRVFLLSPANASGERARLLFNESAAFDVAARLRSGAATLGEAFSFISGLYFRGKLAYANAFAAPPQGIPHAYVIAAGLGLVPPETPVDLACLRRIASVPVDASEPRYRSPVERDARALASLAGSECDMVLLGSVASMKYLDPLFRVFGDRLLFPLEFLGRGDMSRGGLMLRSARAGAELDYVPVGRATRHGPRPPRLPKLTR
jgi:hypothetical protein